MSAANSKILIIDDDQELSAMLGEFLATEHLDIDASDSGEDGLRKLAQQHYDLVILDVMLPVMSGLDVLKDIRTRSDIPIIMLTARGDDIDRILGLEFGADDYLAKPFNPRELLARIKAILRRTRTAEPTPATIRVGSLQLDVQARSLRVDDKPLRLTGTEFELLRCLAESPGDVVPKEQLSVVVLGRKHLPYDRSIDTHVSNVRGKLLAAGIENPTIRSQRGVGYTLLLDDR